MFQDTSVIDEKGKMVRYLTLADEDEKPENNRHIKVAFKSLKKLNATQQKMYTEFDYFGDREEGKDAFLKVQAEYDQYK